MPTLTALHSFNLALTAAIAALAYYDDALLDEFLLDTNVRLRPGVRSLYSVLKEVCDRVVSSRELAV
jgi:hypothetical protein